MKTATLEDAQMRLPALVDQLASGEPILIVREGVPVAQLLAPPKVKPQPKFGSAKGMMTIVSEDEEHLKDFEEYMP